MAGGKWPGGRGRASAARRASMSNTLLINLNMLEWSDINKNFYSGLGKGLYSVNEGVKWEE